MEFKRNVAWCRNKRPVIFADGTFANSVTMNPWAYVEGDTVYLFYAGDKPDGHRQIRLATAPVSDPEDFTFRGIVVDNSDVYGSFDYSWCVLPHVVRLPDGTYYMLYSGNRGYGVGLASFPGIGVATSKDLIHWKKYENNPVIVPGGEYDYPLIGIAGGGLVCEDRGGGKFRLHLYYTGCPTHGDNIFLNQQKVTCYTYSDDGINWEYQGIVRTRSTKIEYEDIATASGNVIRDEDGLWRSWYSAIGTRWGVYSICYSESSDGIHWTRGERLGENLALAPEVRDIGETDFLPWRERWQDQSVSYPTVIRTGNGYRMYYSGNDYGSGGIGTAVSSPMRIALTGEEHGKAKMWMTGDDELYRLMVFGSVSAGDLGELDLYGHQEGFTHSGSVYFEEFPGRDGASLFSLRAIAVHEKDGVRIDIFAENRSASSLGMITVRIDLGKAPVTMSSSDADISCADSFCTVPLGELGGKSTVCKHLHMLPSANNA